MNRLSNAGITYDDAGRMVSDGTDTYTWDRAGRLRSAGTSTYTYNGTGQRLQQTSGGVDTDYLLDVEIGLEEVLVSTTGSDVTRYVHTPFGLSHQQQPDNSWRFLLEDGLGRVRGVVDSVTVVQHSQHFAPFGEIYAQHGTQQTVYGFTGEPEDLNGLIYLRDRYYHPALGVMVSPDPFAGLVSRPMSMNGYSYVEGNPSNWTDPSGQCAFGAPCPGIVEDAARAGASVVRGGASTARDVGNAIYNTARSNPAEFAIAAGTVAAVGLAVASSVPIIAGAGLFAAGYLAYQYVSPHFIAECNEVRRFIGAITGYETIGRALDVVRDPNRGLPERLFNFAVATGNAALGIMLFESGVNLTRNFGRSVSVASDDALVASDDIIAGVRAYADDTRILVPVGTTSIPRTVYQHESAHIAQAQSRLLPSFTNWLRGASAWSISRESLIGRSATLLYLPNPVELQAFARGGQIVNVFGGQIPYRIGDMMRATDIVLDELRDPNEQANACECDE